MVLKSEKKMKSDLQGTWQRSFQGRATNARCLGDTIPYEEYWIFKDDNFYTTLEFLTPISCDGGTPDFTYLDGVDTNIVSKFKIDTRIFDAFLKFQIISGEVDSPDVFVDKWEFITLDNDVLYLAADNPKGNSVLQVEFYKIK